MGAKAKDVSDLAKDGKLSNDAARGATPLAVVPLARDAAAKLATEQLENGIRELPSHIPSECELIAAILWSGTFAPGRFTVETVGDILDDVSKFHLPAHRAIWLACVDLAAAKVSPTATTVHAEMVRARSERSGGGIAYLELLVRDAKPMSEPAARAYAQTVHETWVRRNMISAAARVDRAAREGSTSLEEALAGAVTVISAVAASSAQADKSFIRLRDALSIMLIDMKKPRNTMVKTGFEEIDDAIGGLAIHETSVLAARTSVGKTALACQWAEYICGDKENKRAVYYVSLEMRAALFAGRLAANKARVEAKKLRRGTLNETEIHYVKKAVFEMKEQHLYFVDNLVQTMQSINIGARALRKKLATDGVELALIVIDHIGLVKPSSGSFNKKQHEQIGETSRAMRHLATEHNCHALAIAQINRDGAKRTDKDPVPKLHELKGCGGLEEDADNVFILHRERTKKGSFVTNAGADFVIAKARNDGTAELKLDLDEEFIRFSKWTGGKQ